MMDETQIFQSVPDPQASNPIAGLPDPNGAQSSWLSGLEGLASNGWAGVKSAATEVVGGADSLLSGSVSDTSNALSEGYSALKSVGNDALTGVQKVESLVTAPIQNTLFIVIIGIAVLGGALYYAGKGGGIKVAV